MPCFQQKFSSGELVFDVAEAKGFIKVLGKWVVEGGASLMGRILMGEDVLNQWVRLFQWPFPQQFTLDKDAKNPFYKDHNVELLGCWGQM